jgi:hypothetical protein
MLRFKNHGLLIALAMAPQTRSAELVALCMLWCSPSTMGLSFEGTGMRRIPLPSLKQVGRHWRPAALNNSQQLLVRLLRKACSIATGMQRGFAPNRLGAGSAHPWLCFQLKLILKPAACLHGACWLPFADGSACVCADELAGYAMLGPSFKMAPSFFEAAAALGKPLHAWVVNTPEALYK